MALGIKIRGRRARQYVLYSAAAYGGIAVQHIVEKSVLRDALHVADAEAERGWDTSLLRYATRGIHGWGTLPAEVRRRILGGTDCGQRYTPGYAAPCAFYPAGPAPPLRRKESAVDLLARCTLPYLPTPALRLLSRAASQRVSSADATSSHTSSSSSSGAGAPLVDGGDPPQLEVLAEESEQLDDEDAPQPAPEVGEQIPCGATEGGIDWSATAMGARTAPTVVGSPDTGTGRPPAVLCGVVLREEATRVRVACVSLIRRGKLPQSGTVPRVGFIRAQHVYNKDKGEKEFHIEFFLCGAALTSVQCAALQSRYKAYLPRGDRSTMVPRVFC